MTPELPELPESIQTAKDLLRVFSPERVEEMLRAYGSECARLATIAERERAERYRDALATIAAQGSANPGSTSRVDCMAAIAAAAIRNG